MNQAAQRRVEPVISPVENRGVQRKTPSGRVIVYDVANDQPIGELGNISPEGLMMVGVEPIDEGHMLDLRFQVPQRGDKDVEIEVSVKCQWCVELGSGRTWSGFEIVAIPSDHHRQLAEVYLYL